MTFEETKKAMAKYCRNEASYSYLKDAVTDYIETRKIKNQSHWIETICEDLFTVRCMLEAGEIWNGSEKFKFIKGYMQNLK